MGGAGGWPGCPQFPEWLLEELLLLINTQATLGGEFLIGIWGMHRLRSQAAGLFLVFSTALRLLLIEPSPSSGNTSAARLLLSLQSPGQKSTLFSDQEGSSGPCYVRFWSSGHPACWQMPGSPKDLGTQGGWGQDPQVAHTSFLACRGFLPYYSSFCPPPPS